MLRQPVSGVALNPLVGLLPRDMQCVPVGVPIRSLAPVPRGLLVCRVNGEWLSRESWESLTRDGDVIEWHDRPQDKEDVRSILQIAAVIASIVPGLQPFAPYLYAAAAAYNVLVPPSQLQPGRRPEETGTLSSTGVNGNEARLDQPIPKVCGRREFNPPFACRPYSRFLPRVGAEPDDQDLDNQQWFYALYAVGIGNHDVVAKLANTPISRFSDVLVAQYLAPGVPPSMVDANVTTASEVAAQVLEPGQYVGGIAACAPGRTCTAIEIDVAATRGLGKTGDLTVEWQVEYRPINDFGQVLGGWAILGNESRTAFTATPQRWTSRYEFESDALRPEIRLVRTNIQDSDPAALHEIAWIGMRAFHSEPAALNEHCAHYELVMRSSDQLSNAASRDLRLIAEAHARTWEPTSDSDGGWQTEVHTRNPAWWLLDLITSDTWGINKPDDRVDLQSFAQLAQTCEARQDRFDWVFDSRLNAWDAMQLIARSFRSRVFRRNGVISVARDELADLPVTAFTPRNCSPGMTIDEKLPNRKSPDGVIIEYQDHRTLEWTPIECPCPGVSEMVNPVHIHLEGVMGAMHAEREGIYQAASMVYRPQTAAWSTEMQGLLPAFMSPVDFLPDIRGYGSSGDVALWDVDTLTMTLTEPPDFTAGPLYLTLIRDDGTLTDDVLVTAGATDHEIVLPSAPDFDLVLDSGVRERPKYLIGRKELVKVVSISDGGKTEDGAQLFDLVGVIDDERVHTADAHLLPETDEIQDPVGDPDQSPGGDSDPPPIIVDINSREMFTQVEFGTVDNRSGIRLNNDGSADALTYDATTPMANQWLRFNPSDVATAGLFEVMATVNTAASQPPGATIISGTLDTWLTLDTDREWLIDDTPPAPDFVPVEIFTVYLNLQIREISTGIVQDSAVFSLYYWQFSI